MFDLLKILSRGALLPKDIIDSGRLKNTGGHDHRTNTGDNRTPSQKSGDKSRRKPG